MLSKAIAGIPSDLFPDFEKSLASQIGSNKDTFDLYPFYSLLVSSVTNKNSDTFDRIEVFNARHSPKLKPLNFMHDQKKIYGHIIDCVAVDDNMKVIPDDTKAEELPFKIHLIVANVLYRVWEDKDQQSHIDDIINKMSKGNIYVSMEALFRGFDFVIANPNGSQSLIVRTPETNFLSKHLRQYGGSGRVLGKSISRLLRDVTFSGCGIVDNPANPDSIISPSFNSVFKSDSAEVISVNANLNSPNNNELVYKPVDNNLGDKLMNATEVKDTTEYKTLAEKLDKLVAENARLHSVLEAKAESDKEAVKKDAEDKDKEVATLKAKLDEKDCEMAKEKAAKDEEVDNLKKATSAAQVENDAMRATLDAYRKAERNAKRTEALMKADNSLTREAAFAEISKPTIDSMSDDSFNGMVGLVANYAAKAPKPITPEKVLSNVTPEATATYGVPTVTSTDHSDVVRAQVKNWFKSTKSEVK